MKNNWYVITGAPSSGKTTTLKYLEKIGKLVYYEWARIYIDEELKKGRTLKEIRKDEYEFQKKILELKVNFEKRLPKKDLIFMERGIPDTIAYMHLLHIHDDTSLKRALKNCSYKKIFLLELLDYKLDYARTESQEEAQILENLLETSYTDLMIPVIKVPKMSVQKRADFILRNL